MRKLCVESNTGSMISQRRLETTLCWVETNMRSASISRSAHGSLLRGAADVASPRTLPMLRSDMGLEHHRDIGACSRTQC